MECPKCGADMEKVTYQEIQVDRCTRCKGIWFDMLEAEQLKRLKGSEDIDTGDPKLGKVFSKVEKINCPVCHTQMIRMVDLDQPHIWYEACTVCYGLFFDAGEFRDYKEETVLDFFKDLFTEERR
ncbi:MAG: hypothetical protein AMS16_06440 [Planctomycetes bacterium DG_58]|nr:MAG: hypothetical protein AMS16_06440 [Planctomycetes bacterium DG_58]KPL01502.1 MAG: hypothetical protein AMK75_04600 [Planctomycetes bacterium SM23_65]